MTDQHHIVPSMTDHPITPPPELVQKWWDNVPGTFTSLVDETELATQAAQWGADQELEACLEWFQEFYKTESWVKHDLKHFRDARRPKPPTLKERIAAAITAGDERTALSLLNEALDD